MGTAIVRWLFRGVPVAVCIAWVVVGIGAAPQQPGGRGGGPSPGAVLWTDHCAGCHGTGAAAGRARNLFDEAWLNRIDDARMTDAIRNGVANSEMPAFGRR